MTNKRNLIKIVLTILLFLAPMVCPTAAAKNIYVDANGGNNGSRANFQPDIQYPSIQAAIDAAIDGDTIILAPGTFRGDGNRDIDFKGKAITLRSTDPNDPNIVAATIIDCNGTELENHRGFYFHSSEDENSVVEGLTITNGFNGTGGGILCIASSPIIRNNIITGNKIEYDADGGAGIGCWGGASPLIVGNTISDNHCEPGGGGGGIRCYGASSPTITDNIIAGNSASQGGGICCYGNPTISNCTFRGNTATGIGGGILIDGSPILTNCTFSGNSADSGGAIYNYQCSPTLTNCRFIANSARYSGGAIYNTRGSSPTLRNCIFTGNIAGNIGGAMYNHGYTSINEPTVVNCTFAANSALHGNALACDSYLQKYPSDLRVANCILWDGGDEVWNNDGSTITITYSDVQNACPGEGNIDADPYFADANNGDYHLLSSSPCIDMGDNTVVTVTTDLDGNPRIINGTVDMGAYEYQGPRTIYVDDDAPNDPAPGDPTISDPCENGSIEHPYDAIQEAIEMACNKDIVLVADGTYTGDGNRDIDFLGKAITIKSENGAENCVIDGERINYHIGFIFQNKEDENSIVDGFTITNEISPGNGGGVYCFNSSSPTIMNCIITKNEAEAGAGIHCRDDSSPKIIDCIISENIYQGLFCDYSSSPTLINCIISGNYGSIRSYIAPPMLTNCTIIGIGKSVYGPATLTNCIVWGKGILIPDNPAGLPEATYSCIKYEGVYPGIGNINADPLFVDPNSNDYHLKSQAGRWDANDVRWTKDEVTSSCIDAGDPGSPIGYEPFPNGGIINMGAYGGTGEASKSYFGQPVCETIIAGDINGDCRVNFKDFALMALHWLQDENRE